MRGRRDQCDRPTVRYDDVALYSRPRPDGTPRGRWLVRCARSAPAASARPCPADLGAWGARRLCGSMAPCERVGVAAAFPCAVRPLRRRRGVIYRLERRRC